MNSWRLHRGGDLSRWEDIWRRACSSASGTVFQRFALCREWVRVFASDGRLRVWVLEAPQPAVAAFTVGERKLQLLGQGLFDYPQPVGAVTVADQRELARQLRRWDEWDVLSVTGIRKDSAYGALWRELGAEWAEYSAAPYLGPETDLEEFEWRHRRLLRRLERQSCAGWSIHRLERREEKLRLLDWILRQKERNLRQQGRDNVLTVAAGDWLRGLLRADAVELEMWQLWDGRAPVAGLAAWQSPPVRAAYTISYSPQAAHNSPGMLLLCGVARHTLAEGGEFDLLTGEQPFKTRLAGARRRLLRLTAKRTRPDPAEATARFYDGGTESRVR